MKTEAEAGISKPQPRAAWSPPEAGEQEGCPTRGRGGPVHTGFQGPAPGTGGERIPVFKPPACGPLLGPPRDTDPDSQ